ncbi:MAG: OprO/OprP family phosphate-selective porin [Caulobacteraceae bacterium]
MSGFFETVSARAFLLGALALAASLGASGAALAQQSPASAADARDARIGQLEAQARAMVAANRSEAAQIQALTSAIGDLETARSAPAEAIQTIPPPAPPPAKGPPAAIASIAGGKPVIASADGRFSLTLHGIAQFDAALYDQSPPGPIATDERRSGPALGASATNVDLTHARQLKDGDLFRRARIGFDGTAYGDVDYRLIFDFGSGGGVENAGQLYEAWVQYSGLEPFKFRIGAFPPSIGLEDQGSTSFIPLLERSAAGDIARGFVAGDTRTAAEVFANGDHWLASFAVTGRAIGVINTGTASPTPQTYGDQLGLVGRLAATPLHGSDWLIHVGAHGSYLVTPPNVAGPPLTDIPPASGAVTFSNTPELRVDGTRLINTGAIPAAHADEAGLEFAVQKRNFLLQSEYEHFDVERTGVGVTDPHFQGWYVEGSWILTGEARKYNPQSAAFDGPPVAHPFDPAAGSWGAVELAARYSDMDLNYHAGALGTAPAADAIRGGDLRVIGAGINWYWNPLVRFMFDYQHVHLDRLSPDAALYQTAQGAQIGQSYDAFSMRSQFAF